MVKKQYDVFISYAEPDQMIAKTLKHLLADVGLTSFFAKEDIPTSIPYGFQDGIITEGIKKSSCYIMICTQDSIDRSWVLFEAGAARAFDLKCYRTRVERTTDAEIGAMPNPGDANNYKLFDKGNLKDLFKLIAKDSKGSAKQTILNRITEYFTGHDSYNLTRLMGLASVRWAFIAGNKPSGNQKLTPARQNHMHTFVKNLSKELLESGFSITACPQVEDVGKIALFSAETFIASQTTTRSSSLFVDYAIGGIHPIDRDVRNLNISQKTKSKWQEHLMDFRMSYLNNQEWLVLLGGSTGTGEEYEAVQRLNSEEKSQIKTYAIPCFGGAAKKIFHKLQKSGDVDYLAPCVNCRKRKHACTRIEDIVKSMVNA